MGDRVIKIEPKNDRIDGSHTIIKNRKHNELGRRFPMKLDHTFGRKSILTVALSLLMAGGIAQGATVPEGVTLADKQVLVRNNGSEPQSLDPNKIEGVPESQLSRDLFEGLTIIDPEGNVIPGSATAWEHDEFRVWRFTLRNEAKWSNGDPVTAHDFVYSWKRLADPNTA